LVDVGNVGKMEEIVSFLLSNLKEYDNIHKNNLEDINNYGLKSITEAYLKVYSV